MARGMMDILTSHRKIAQASLEEAA